MENINIKILIALAILIAVIALVPQAYGIYDSAAKALFEGSSYGKSVLFLAWLFLLFGLAQIKERGKFSPATFKHSIWIVVILLGAIWAWQIQIHAALMSSYNMPIDSTAAILLKEKGTLQWEATQLVHIHATKGALCPILGAIPFGGFDSGCPMFNLVPVEQSMLFLILGILLLLFLINEFLGTEKLSERCLFALFSFGAVVSIFDGGPFSIIGRITIALLAAFILLRDEGTKSYWLFIAPFLAVAGVLYGSSFYFQSYSFIFGAYEILLIGIILSVILITRSKMLEKPVWAALLLLFIYMESGHLLSLGFGSDIYGGEETKLMIYGLPENATKESLQVALSREVNVKDVEFYNYVAFATVESGSTIKSGKIEQRLREELKPQSYLFVLKGWDKSKSVIKGPEDLNYLTEIKSDYISFGRELTGGKGGIVAESIFPHPYLGLFVLNDLYNKGIEKPVVVSKAA